MRLIDADALMTWFDNHYDDEEVTVGFVSGLIKDQPTIEPERKKGTITYTHFSEELWGQSAICDLCGCKWQIAEGGEDNFCPNCGANMKKRRTDESNDIFE